VSGQAGARRSLGAQVVFPDSSLSKYWILMKTYENLYPHVCPFENLFLASRGAAKGKWGKVEVVAFEDRPSEQRSCVYCLNYH
jgi:hypothetical protein